MINVLTGLQGSGKSYYAVTEIWKHIKKMHQAEISGTPYKYDKIYTNIEGLIPNRYVERLDVAKLYKLWDWELKQYLRFEAKNEYPMPPEIDFTPAKEEKKRSVSEIIENEIEETRLEESVLDSIEVFETNDKKLLKSIRENENEADPEFIDYTLPHFQKMGFTNCLIIIDEAHNFFGGGLKKPWERLISYHRHYHDQDYLFITQDNKMLNNKVNLLTAYTIRAINPIMRWRSDIFTYGIYSGGYISFSGNNKLETKSLKASDLIFSLYESGGKKSAKSHFLKIILKLLGGIVILAIFGYFAVGNFTHSDPVVVNHHDKNSTIKKKTIIKKEPKNYIPHYIEIFYLVGDDLIHKRTGKKFSYKNFKIFLTDQDTPKSFEENKDGTVKIYYQLTEQTINNLEIQRHDKKNNNSAIFGIN